MKYFLHSILLSSLLLQAVAGDAYARGGRGGGGGGAPKLGGGGGAPKLGGGGAPKLGGGAVHAPSMSRPAGRPVASKSALGKIPTPSNRPAISKPNLGSGGGALGGINRPSGGGERPNLGNKLPGAGDRPSTLPGNIGERPNLGNKLPSAGNRPSTLPGAVGERPNFGNIANRPGKDRPSAGDLNDFLGLPGETNRPNLGDRVNIGDRTNIGNNVNINTGNQIAINRPNNINNIRNRWTNVDNRPFDNNWWGRYPATLPGWGWQAGWNRYPGYWGWRAASWAAFGTWFPWRWTQPVVYDYGTNVVYQNDSVYVDGQQYATAEQYYQQADTIAQSIPEDAQPDKVEWLPLGVFAVAEQDGVDAGMLVQLAVSKEGILAGTFYNDTTDAGRPLEGMVDRETQRAAWKFADGKNAEIVMETGINNLTKDESTALVHFGTQQTQTWLMVRLPEPESKQ